MPSLAPRLVGLFLFSLARLSSGRGVLDSFATRHCSFLLAILGLAGIFAPALFGQATPSAPASAPAIHEVVDEYGRTVRVPVVPQRVISLAPSLTETVFALGLKDRLVGDTDYCDYPAEAMRKPKVGGTMNPNIEQIAALKPDLVLVTKEGNRLETLHALEMLGIPTYATDAHTVGEIISSTQRIADLLGASEAGQAVVADLQRRLDVLQQKLAGVPPRRALFVVWSEPLMSVGRGTFIADAMRVSGAVSIVDSETPWPQVSLEEVVHQQPEYLVFASSHSDGAHDFDAIANRPGWRLMDAVRNRRFAVISDAVIRPAPRLISAVEDLARQLHPEVFQEKVEPVKEVVPKPSPSTEPVHPKNRSSASLYQSMCPEASCAL